MEPITITLLAVVSLLIVPALVALCVDKKDPESSVPQLQSLRKKGSSTGSKKTVKSNLSVNRNSKLESVKEADTVITNGSAVGPHSRLISTSSAHDDAEAPNIINAVLTNGGTTPKSSVVNETSPCSSERSSRASGGQPRVVSQDRALPEIPQPARLSVNSERSPSTKRALPEIPSITATTSVTTTSVTTTSVAAEEEGANHYDQLERDLPPHQIKSKASESSSIKVKMRFQFEDEGSASSETLIEPDEVTRSSVFMSTNPHEVYSSVTDDTTEPAKSDERASLKPLELTKSKEGYETAGDSDSDNGEEESSSVDDDGVQGADSTVNEGEARAPYSKIKKDGASSELKSPSSETAKATGDHAEPVYLEAPPVPAKMFDADDEGAAANAVAIVIDNNAQDSGSGYYAVTNDGPGPELAAPSPHVNVPESYDILTARESIATVRARQAGIDTEEDYYESMDDKATEERPAVNTQVDDGSGATDLYAEIDNERPAPPIAAGASRPPIAAVVKRPMSSTAKEELYAEIDVPQAKVNPPRAATSHHTDSGYEKVDFAAKGEQTDSAGYAIVKEAKGAANNLPNDDEEDYAVCDPPPGNVMHPVPAAIINEQLSRHASDVSDYATVSYGNEEAQASPRDGTQQSAANNERPFQRYQRRGEHVYQEIDEVGKRETPPDKKS